MKFLFEFVPLLAFLVAVLKYDLYVATMVLMIALPIQVAAFWLMYKKFEKMHVITLVMVLVFGAATLAFKNPMFIKWKPTVVNWLFAAVFLGSQLISQKPIIRHMLDAKLTLPDAIWGRLNLLWVGFFFILGGANLFVAYTYDDVIWAKFKVFGMLGATIVFVILQGLYLSRYIEADGSAEE